MSTNGGYQTYNIHIKGSGGSYLIGSITDEAADYWADKGSEELSEYLKNPRFVADIDAAHALRPWRQNSDILEREGLAHIEEIFVETGDGDRVFEADEATIAQNVEPDEDEEAENVAFPRAILVTSREKGVVTYQLNTSEPFDIAKLRLHRIDLMDDEVVTRISYDGTDLSHSEWFGKHYADLEARIA